MVEQAGVKAQPEKRIHNLRLKIDPPLLLAILSLLAISLLMVYSSSWKSLLINNRPQYLLVGRQLIFALVGLGIAFGVSHIDYHKYRRLVVPMMIAILLALIAVQIFGKEMEFGAKRALFNGSIQPSEPAKLAVILYLAFWLNSKKEVLDQINFGLIPLMLIVGLTAGLILIQPDISAMATVVFLGGLLFFIAGGKMRQIVSVMLAGALIGFLIVKIYPTANTRLVDYWNGLQNPTQASDHVKWSFDAIINGGVFGMGIGRSTTKFVGLPVAHTDSIFSVIAEETGLFGALVVISLYLVILWRGLRIAQNAPDDLGKWLAAGITLWIMTEAAMNMGVLVNLLPFAGNALPLVSAGGSSMITTLAGLGLVINVSRMSGRKQTTEGSAYRAVVNLRRGDRRRSVSRPVRPASHR